MRRQYRIAWLKSLAGLCINISAAWFVVPIIGNSIHVPQNIKDIFVLTGDLVFGMVFLLMSVWLERKTEK